MDNDRDWRALLNLTVNLNKSSSTTMIGWVNWLPPLYIYIQVCFMSETRVRLRIHKLTGCFCICDSLTKRINNYVDFVCLVILNFRVH